MCWLHFQFQVELGVRSGDTQLWWLQVWSGQPGDVLAVEPSAAMAELGRQVEAALRSAQPAAEPSESPSGPGRGSARASPDAAGPADLAAAARDAAAGCPAEDARVPDLARRARAAPVRWVRQLPAVAGAWPEQLFLPELGPGRGKARGRREAPRRRGRPQADGFSRRCDTARRLPRLLPSHCMQAPACLCAVW